MKVWKKTSVVLNDGPSLIAGDNLLTIAVAKATSHDELRIDAENASFIYRQVRASPASLKPLVSIIASRIKRTKSWTVALKGLMLMHGFFLRKTTVAESIGRLPFDLSSFGEGNSKMNRTTGFNLFVRAYFAFLDMRSVLFHDANHKYDEESSVMIRLVIIRKMQVIVDSLMRIKPFGGYMRLPLINEAMENVVNEILEVYGWICRRIAEVLPNVHSQIGKVQADLALRIVGKSMTQGDALYKYFEFCKDLRVSNVKEIPNFVRIPVDDVLHLDKLLSTERKESNGAEKTKEEDVDEEENKREMVFLSDLIKLDDDEEEIKKNVEEEEKERKCEVVFDSDLINLDDDDDDDDNEENEHVSSVSPTIVDIPDLISF